MSALIRSDHAHMSERGEGKTTTLVCTDQPRSQSLYLSTQLHLRVKVSMLYFSASLCATMMIIGQISFVQAIIALSAPEVKVTLMLIPLKSLRQPSEATG